MNDKTALTYVVLYAYGQGIKDERDFLKPWEHFLIILLLLLKQDEINGISCGK